MTTKKLTDYLKQQTPTQSSSKIEQTKPAPTRIRFKKETEFQETPIGKIPKEWKVCKLGQIVSLRNGRRPSLIDDGNIPVYGANGIMGYTNKYMVDNEYTLIIGRVGAVGQVHMGRGKIWISDNAIYTEHYDRKSVFLPFLYYYLITKRLEQHASRTTHPLITQTFVENIMICLPSIEEQKAIVEVLSTVDYAIEKIRSLIDKAERFKKGLMQELLTKGIGHKEYQETPIGKIPKEWKIVKLGEVCDSIKEIVEPQTMNPNTPYVGLEHIESGDFLLTRHGIAGEVVSAKYRFYKGDILYGRLRPYLDKCVIASIDGVCSTDFIVIRAKKNLVLPEYIVAILHTERFIKYATSTMKGTNHPRTSWESISKFILPLPSIEEQTKISKTLMTVDRYLRVLKRRLEQLERVKKGLMEVLLRGKVRVIVESS